MSAPGQAGVAVRVAATRAVAAVLHGHSLETVAEKEFSAADKALFRALCYTTLRWYPTLSFHLQALLSKPLKRGERELEALLCVGLAQLACMRVASHAAVHGTVEAARVIGRPRAAGMVNAVLRRFSRERSELEARAARDEQALHAHPAWLIAAIRHDWPEDWQEMLAENNRQAPMWVRVNTSRIKPEQWARRLKDETDCNATSLPGLPAAHCLDRALDVEALPGFREGLVSVQDAAAQLAAPLLAPGPGMRVLDACAAPGGKTGHILELQPDAEVTAVDSDSKRLERLRENLERLGLQATVVEGDVGASGPDGKAGKAGDTGWWDGRPFDRILLDAPCTGSGVIRRHPDIKLLRRAGDAAQLAKRQAALLDAAWGMLSPGGRLVYATCSVFAAEGPAGIAAFLERKPDARENWPDDLRAWGHAAAFGRRIRTGEDAMDGFYYACVFKDYRE